MIELIRKKCKQGDIVKITLDGGREITGALDEISSEHLTLMVDKNPVVLTHKIIVLFEIVKKMEISQPATNPVMDQTQVKSVEPENTPADEVDKQVSDNPTSLIKPTLKVQKETQEFTVELLTNYNEALSYCSYLDDFDICNKVTSLDFKYENPTETKNSIDKKLMRLSAIYDEFKKDPNINSIQPAVAEINSLFADNPGNTNLAWNYFILSCINGDHETAFNCLHTYALKSANTDLKSWQDYYILLIGQTRLYEKLEELIRHCKSTLNENAQLVEFSRKALSYMLYKSKMSTAIESALSIDENNLLKTVKELTDIVPRKSIYSSASSSPRQPQQRRPSLPKTQTRQFYSLTEEINFAVNNGDIKAVDSLYERYKSRSDATKLIQIGTAYQRLGQYDKALEIFNTGLQKYPDKAVGFLTSRVQIYELQNEWTLADGDYKRLLEVNGDTESKRKNYNFQRARVLLKDREINKARNILFELSKKYPTDTGIANALAEIDRVTEDIASGSDQFVEIPIIDIGDDQIEIISPMLRFDIEECDYRDESILKQGNKPTLEDAMRLKSRAMTSIKDQVEMSERYPLFLEAAKAYNDLNPGSYDPTDLYELLARYAALRAGTIFSDLKKKLLMPSRMIDPQTAQLKADTASSYYLESVNLQAMVKPENMLLPLTNHLKIQMAILLYKLNKPLSEDIFSGNFTTIFKVCIASKISELNELAYKSVVTIGSTNVIAWNKLKDVRGGSAVFYGTIPTESKRVMPYMYLSNLSGTILSPIDLPGDALRKVFQARKSQNEHFIELTKSPKLIDFRPQNISNIENIIQEMEKFRALFFESDLVILEKLKYIVNVFKPYETRGANERVSIIVKVRSEIFSIIEFIESNPTYWGRVAFFPILQSWKKSILKLESERIQSVIPRLSVNVDPQVYRRDNTLVSINVVIQNTGQATTDNHAIKIELLDNETGTLFNSSEKSFNQELHVDDHHYYQYQAEVPVNHKGSLFLRVAPSFSYQGSGNQQAAFEFTVSPGDSFDLKVEDIKWNYLKIPDKHMFKGREKDISKITTHVQSPERSLSYILYGLTRTGKTSILKYLKSELYGLSITSSGRTYHLCPIRWDFDQAAAQNNARDLWRYLINTTILQEINTLRETGDLYSQLPQINKLDNPRFKDLGEILSLIHASGFYPVFLIDEFSHIINMIKKKLIDSSFLAQLRSYALEGKASFIFAGTYDINNLVTDPEFGITGQFANVIKMKVSKINKQAAAELIHAMGDKLQFTDLAVKHILELSFCIPYFIQIICYHCAKYALENEITYIGYPEVEEVVKILSGENENDPDSVIQRLEAERFSNNLLSSADPPETSALLATIAHSNYPFTPYHEIIRIWGEHKIKEFQSVVAQTLDTLVDKEILLRKEEEGEFYFKISVGLFERWLRKEIPNLNYALDKLHKITE